MDVINSGFLGLVALTSEGVCSPHRATDAEVLGAASTSPPPSTQLFVR